MFFSFFGHRKEEQPAKPSVTNDFHFVITGHSKLNDEALEAIKRKLLIRTQAEGEALFDDVGERIDGNAAAENEPSLYEKFCQQTHCAWALQLQLQNERGDVPVFEDWARFAPQATWGTIQKLGERLANDLAMLDDARKTLTVPDIVLAGLAESDIHALRLSPDGSLSLDIEQRGIPGEKDFTFKVTVRREDRAVFGTLEGMLFKRSRTTHLLSPSIFMALDAVSNCNSVSVSASAEQNDRRIAFASASEILRATGIPGAASAAGRMRLLTANQLSIELDPETGEIQPVILRPEYKAEGEERKFKSLLTPRQTRDLRILVSKSKTLPKTFSLGNGTYLLLTREVRSVLSVIAEKSKGSPKERAAFAANPRKALLDVLENDSTSGQAADWEDRLGRVFFETPEFLSQRVSAFGPWSPKHCGFVTPIKTNWFGDGEAHYVMTIAGKPFPVTTESVKSLLKKIDEARRCGNSHVAFEGTEFEIDEIDIEALKSFLEEVSPAAEVQPDEALRDRDDENERPEKKDKKQDENSVPEVRFGPIISDNIEQLNYLAEIKPRPAYSPEVAGFAPGFALLPHQREALDWLQDLWQRGIPGALLADDMGLGKTFQCLSFLKWIADHQGRAEGDDPAPALVVAPAGLVRNWVQEAKSYFDGSFPPPLVLTSQHAKELLSRPVSERKTEIESHTWAVASYETMRDKIELFLGIQWGLIVFDEAQRIKTPTALLTETAKSLKSNFVLALTGTPVENSLTDLWSILDAVVPGCMGSLAEFSTRFVRCENPLEAGRTLHKWLTGDFPTKDKTPVKLMLRRLKTERLKALPEKEVHVLPVSMPPEQHNAYSEALRLKKSGKKGDALRALHQLASISLLPEVIDDDLEITDDVIRSSARLTAFFQILDDIKAKGEKAIVFVNRLAVLHAIARAIRVRYGLEELPDAIYGSMSGPARQAVVNRFQNSAPGFDVLVLSIRAASTGITLTAANHVIHLERWWNPAVEDQASDRVYRIGQKAPKVFVHIPLAVYDGTNVASDSSFDAILDRFLTNKREMSRNVLMPTYSDADEAELMKAVFGQADDSRASEATTL
ncbi:DEAD/DEAH box helicase [Sutterella massiliensis]|uniref:DEAD/DEAH box helicase n=1 Tax=Sutterella massiliensis TaxID=1816689 RepID=A0ABS2DTZ3_9BURK|nr:DEAD/DEAH box helicase [Sutterella massiliensis]MBM6704185.1 DEAD/DEAH box helicase [Sutterella massiliensis]